MMHVAAVNFSLRPLRITSPLFSFPPSSFHDQVMAAINATAGLFGPPKVVDKLQSILKSASDDINIRVSRRPVPTGTKPPVDPEHPDERKENKLEKEDDGKSAEDKEADKEAEQGEKEHIADKEEEKEGSKNVGREVGDTEKSLRIHTEFSSSGFLSLPT